MRDNHRLDFGIGGAGYAVFGEVVEGMDVVDRIAMVPTTSRGPHENVPQMAVVIQKVREVEATAPAPKAADACRSRRRAPRGCRDYRSEKALSSSSAFVGSSFRMAASPLRRA